MKNGFRVVCLMGCLAAFPAGAESDFVVGAHVGTMGPGLDLAIGIGEKIDARLGFNAYTLNRDGTESDIDYEMDLKLSSFFAQLDWHPMGGKFFLTGGGYVNGNELEGKAKPSLTYDIGGTTYTASDVGTLTATIDFDDFAPYLGLGWGSTARGQEGLSFRMDLGLIYQGSPKVNLEADGALASDPALQADLEQEEKELQETLDDFEWYPLVQLGVSYAFR